MKLKRTLVVPVVALGAAGGTVAAADTISAVVAPDGTINGCYQTATGLLRVAVPNLPCITGVGRGPRTTNRDLR
jgi:hypothetical protein